MKNISVRLSLITALIVCSGAAQAGFVSTGLLVGGGMYSPSVAGLTVSAGMAPVFGGRVDIGAGPLGVMADVLYTTRKAELPGAISKTLNYLSVPVQARLSTGLIKFTGGVYYAKGLGDVKNEIAGVSSEQSFSADNKKSTDFGMVGGLGLGFPLGVASLTLEARYSQSLSDINTDTISYKNRAVDVIAGIMF